MGIVCCVCGEEAKGGIAGYNFCDEHWPQGDEGRCAGYHVTIKGDFIGSFEEIMEFLVMIKPYFCNIRYLYAKQDFIISKIPEGKGLP